MKKTAAGFPDDEDDKRPLTDEERELRLILADDSLAEVARQIASEDEGDPLP